MPAQNDDAGGHARSPEADLDALLNELPTEFRSLAPQTTDDWLRLGLRLGLERPELARRLLESTAPWKPGAPAVAGPAAGKPAGNPVDPTAAENPAEAPSVPFRSRLLAQAALTAAAERLEPGEEPAFGWAATLAPAEIVQLGRVVDDMLRSGEPADIARGFGIVWHAGVRLPRAEQAALIGEFIELEITVAGVLTGRDLRAEEPASPPRGLRAFFDLRLARQHPSEAEAAAVIQRRGETVQHGLVALWNAWMALRYRERVPGPTFELLVRPWVSVVGPLPEP